MEWQLYKLAQMRNPPLKSRSKVILKLIVIVISQMFIGIHLIIMSFFVYTQHSVILVPRIYSYLYLNTNLMAVHDDQFIKTFQPIVELIHIFKLHI